MSNSHRQAVHRVADVVIRPSLVYWQWHDIGTSPERGQGKHRFIAHAEAAPLCASEGCETGATGLEPATSGVTGRRSNQLNYAPGRA